MDAAIALVPPEDLDEELKYSVESLHDVRMSIDAYRASLAPGECMIEWDEISNDPFSAYDAIRPVLESRFGSTL